MTSPARDNEPSRPAAVAVPLPDRVFFYVLLAVLGARALIGESYERLELSFLSALAPGGGVTPVTTAWLDAVVLAAAGVALARRQRWRGRLAIALGLLLLAAGYGVSTVVAADSYMARFVGASLLIGVLGGVALAALVQTRWMLHLLVATLLATGVTTAYKCVRQVTDEFPATKQMWEREFKPQLIARGYDPTDPLFINYERRMASREACGFLAHPNVTGSVLMMTLLAACGLLIGLLRRGPQSETGGQRWVAALVAAGGVLLSAVGMWLTGSLGAIGGAGLGVAALLLLGCCARWASAHTRRLLVLLAAGYVGVVAVVATYGLRTGTLPHPSLEFRWYYWTAAARAYADAPWTGIGRYNFPAAYLCHKAPESTEEVKDPHNLWVSLLVELGPLGLAGGVLLCGVTVLRGVRRLNQSMPASAQALSPRAVFWQATPLVIGVLLVHALFSGTDGDEPAVWLLWAVDVGVVWMISLSLALWLLARVAQHERGMAWLSAGLCAAVLAALVHGLLDFTLMTPGGLALFTFCAAGAAATIAPPREREAAARRARPWTATIGWVAAVALVAAHVWQIAVPVQMTQRRLQRLERYARAGVSQNDFDSLQATAQEILRACDDEAVRRAAVQAVLRQTRTSRLPVEQQLRTLEALHRQVAESHTQPVHAGTWATRARLESELAHLHGLQGDARAAGRSWRCAAESWDRAVALYPTNPRMRISAGQAWLEVWRGSVAGPAAGRIQDHAAQRAREHFEAALRIDQTRPTVEVQRLHPAERQAVESALGELN